MQFDEAPQYMAYPVSMIGGATLQYGSYTEALFKNIPAIQTIIVAITSQINIFINTSKVFSNIKKLKIATAKASRYTANAKCLSNGATKKLRTLQQQSLCK